MNIGIGILPSGGIADGRTEVEAHGSFGDVRCIDCKAQYYLEEYRECVLAKRVMEARLCAPFTPINLSVSKTRFRTVGNMQQKC